MYAEADTSHIFLFTSPLPFTVIVFTEYYLIQFPSAENSSPWHAKRVAIRKKERKRSDKRNSAHYLINNTTTPPKVDTFSWRNVAEREKQ